MKEHLIIIENEKMLQNLLYEYLSEEGYNIDTIADCLLAKEKFKDNHFDLAILDIDSPLNSGIDLLKDLKSSENTTPLLIISVRNKTEDKFEGFLLGADDYLTKPFAIEELLMRIRAILNRTKTTIKLKLSACDVELDLINRTLKRGNKEKALSPTEFKLLEYFFKNKNQIISKKKLAEQVWGYSFDTGTNIVNVYINYVRKIIDTGFDKKLLRTVKGKGFILLDK